MPDPAGTTSVSREDLAALRDKYERILALRVAHEREPPAQLAPLARQFPGALRELDDLPLDVVRARIALLARAEGDATAAEPWMLAQAMFHRLARGALLAKGWLRGRKEVDENVRAAFAEHVRTLDAPADRADALAWKDDLAEIARPPRGRVVDLVLARVAAILAIERRAAKALVFGPRRRRSRR